MAATGTRKEISLERQRRYAWAQYYSTMGQRADDARRIVAFVPITLSRDGTVTPQSALPAHITTDFYEMAVALRREFNCPVCFEQVSKETITITVCGHIYCKPCKEAIDKSDNPCCALCRHKFGKKY